jgi:iron(III) transport system substrate-binding protein
MCLKKLLIYVGIGLILSGCTQKKKVWIYTSIYKEVIEEIKAPLQAAIPEAEIEWFQSGSENVASKVSTELAAGRTKADLILTSDPFWYYELKQNGKLLPYKSEAAKNIPSDFTDPDAAFALVRLPVMVIGYNSEALQADELPKTWKDLAQPKWKGKIAMPSPLESGSSFTAVAIHSHLLGWDFFKELRKQEILAAGGNSTVITRLETRERTLGIVLLENILKAQAKGSPVRPIYPEDGVIPVSSPIAIMKDSAHPEIAKKIYDWFYSEASQKAMVRSGMYSLIPGIDSHNLAKPIKDLMPRMAKWTPELLKQLYGEREQIKAKFAEIVLH